MAISDHMLATIFIPLDVPSPMRWKILSEPDCADESPVGLHIDITFWNQFYKMEVPESWLATRREISLAPNESFEEARERLLKAFLFEAKDRGLLKASSDEVFEHKRPYPRFNIRLETLSETSIKTAMFNIFSKVINTSYEQVGCDLMQSMLKPFFHVPGCLVYESFSLPPMVATVTSFPPRPFLENRFIIDGVPDTIWPSLQISIIWDARTLQEGQARLASHFEWSLKFILLLHRPLILQTSPDDAESMSNILPEWCYLLGILCDVSGVKVYIHYPRWDTAHKCWECVSTLICTLSQYTFVNPTFINRVDLLKTLLSVQRHTAHVREQIQMLISKSEPSLDLVSLLTAATAT